MYGDLTIISLTIISAKKTLNCQTNPCQRDLSPIPTCLIRTKCAADAHSKKSAMIETIKEIAHCPGSRTSS